MPKASRNTDEKQVTVEVLRKFHVGTDKPVHYAPGVIEMPEGLAKKVIALGYAKKVSEPAKSAQNEI